MKSVSCKQWMSALKKHGWILDRTKGSHHIFVKIDIEEIINIQPIKSKAKAYQVKQVRNIILKYRLGVKDE